MHYVYMQHACNKLNKRSVYGWHMSNVSGNIYVNRQSMNYSLQYSFKIVDWVPFHSVLV